MNDHLTSSILEGTEVHRQIQRETNAVRDGVLRYRRMVADCIARGDASDLKPVQQLMARWYPELIKAIRAHQSALRRNQSLRDKEIGGPVLLLADPEHAAVCTMNETMRMLLLGEAKIPALSYAIGQAVMGEIHLDLLRIQNREHSETIAPEMERLTTPMERAEFKKKNRSPYKMLMLMCQRMTSRTTNWWAKKHLEEHLWTRRVCAAMGFRLMQALRFSADVGSEEGKFILAFTQETKAENGGKRGVQTVKYLRLSDRTQQLIQRGVSLREHLRPPLRVMICPPAPWREGCGGYYRLKPSLMGKMEYDQRLAVKAADMSQIERCVDALNATAWRINRRVYAVQKELWATGGGIAGIPYADPIPLPPRPTGEISKEEKRERWEIAKKNMDAFSLRRNWEMVMGEVEDVLNEPSFWQAHQVDFRGRAYTLNYCPNHQNDDTQRALFEFATPVKVDARARWWIKVHTAGVLGIDKVSFDDRVKWVDSHMDEIKSWAADPMANQGWMYEPGNGKPNKKAFQVLAAAFALVDDNAAARLPVQVDGTCNGLQHYAALGRDPKGAAAVNLIPSDKPADIYSEVAGTAAHRMEEDCRDGVVGALLAAKYLGISRAVAKAIVMPSVYGITEVGGNRAMLDLLDEEMDLRAIRLDWSDRTVIASYLSKTIFKARRGVCPAADGIMDWLRVCAQRISAAGHTVRWDTPLGLPVVQHYRSSRAVRIHCMEQSIQLREIDGTCKVAKGKQSKAFAPNFVHSLDATHMMMTVRSAKAAGIEVGTIHDAYAAHAAHMDKLGQIIRSEFVALHSRPLLDELHTDLKKRYPDVELPAPPPAGTLDIRCVLESPYFFA